MEFGRGLNFRRLTCVPCLTQSSSGMPQTTLLVTRVAVFLANDNEHDHVSAQRFELSASHGLNNLSPAELKSLDADFLDFDKPGSNNHLFLENPQQVLRLPESQRLSAARLDLNYYLPCRVASREGSGTRTVAVIGLGRTNDGDFLSSEEMEALLGSRWRPTSVSRSKMHSFIGAPGAEDHRLRTVEGVQREYRRIHQHRHLRRRPRRPRGKLERSDGGHVCEAARRGSATAALRALSSGVHLALQRGSRRAGHAHALQVPSRASLRRKPCRQHRYCSAGHAKLYRHRPHYSRRRHHRSHSDGGPAYAVGETLFDWTARGRSRT